jgi:hypothetical protein
LDCGSSYYDGRNAAQYLSTLWRDPDTEIVMEDDGKESNLQAGHGGLERQPDVSKP